MNNPIDNDIKEMLIYKQVLRNKGDRRKSVWVDLGLIKLFMKGLKYES